MTLTFTHIREYGRVRFYPFGPEAEAVVTLARRKSLDLTCLQTLDDAGFSILLLDGETNNNITFAGYLQMLRLLKGDV